MKSYMYSRLDPLVDREGEDAYLRPASGSGKGSRRVVAFEVPADAPDFFPLRGQTIYCKNGEPRTVVAEPYKRASRWFIVTREGGGAPLSNYQADDPKAVKEYSVTVRVQATSQEEAEQLVQVGVV